MNVDPDPQPWSESVETNYNFVEDDQRKLITFRSEKTISRDSVKGKVCQRPMLFGLNEMSFIRVKRNIFYSG